MVQSLFRWLGLEQSSEFLFLHHISNQFNLMVYYQSQKLWRIKQHIELLLIPIVAGSEKTTVSVATGHQEYHPVYISPGNLLNTAQQRHGNAVLPVAFLTIPKGKWLSNYSFLNCKFDSSTLHVDLEFLAQKYETSKPEYQCFVQQLYQACIACIFAPLKCNMTTPDIICCPNGHFCHVVYSIGPYIAD